MDELAVTNFREYLQIPSVHPNINYDACVSFIEKQAKSLDLQIRHYRCLPDKPIVVLTWPGKEPSLPSILLNGHMDVVPVFEDQWTHKPFDAEIDPEGNIYARGAQDMKSVSIQYLEAIRRLKNDNVLLKRTVHVSFVPDEEIGGLQGMGEFVKTQDFKDLNVGFVLDEGTTSADDFYILYYGERTVWEFQIHCPGQTGHGLLLLENTAGEKVRRVLDKFYDFRQKQQKKLQDDPSLTIGDVTTINLTKLMGGVQSNVIPPEFVLVFDCRIALTVDVEEFEETLKQWCKESGEGVWIEYEVKQPQIPATTLDDSNPFWVAFKKSADDLHIKLAQRIGGGASDARFLREVGISAVCFSPINNTPPLLHNNNEFLNKSVFLRGIEIYYALIPAVANV